jgi:hypothetical protein
MASWPGGCLCEVRADNLQHQLGELSRDGNDPSTWMQKHREEFARAIAAQRELAAREQLTREQAEQDLWHRHEELARDRGLELAG